MGIRIYDEDILHFVDVPSFSFNDSRSFHRVQSGTEDMTGAWLVTDRGYTTHTLVGVISGMTSMEKNNFRDFVVNTLEGGKKGFWILFTNQRSGSTWNPHKVKIFADAIVGGSTIMADGTYMADEYIPADLYLEGPFRLRKTDLKFVEQPGRGGGVYNVSIQAVQEVWE